MIQDFQRPVELDDYSGLSAEEADAKAREIIRAAAQDPSEWKHLAGHLEKLRQLTQPHPAALDAPVKK